MGTKRIKRIEDEVGIGAAIRDARIAVGITQASLASALGVTYQQVQNYEKGSVRIAASTLKTIAKVFNVPVGSLFELRPRDGSVIHEGLSLPSQLVTRRRPPTSRPASIATSSTTRPSTSGAGG